jgi:hypothetical protein
VTTERVIAAGVAAPILAFGLWGTTLTGAHGWMIGAGRFAAVPVALAALWCVISMSRLSRFVFGVTFVCWWAGWIVTRVLAEMPLSAFAVLSWVSLPMLAALTLGKPWAGDVVGADADAPR